MNNLSETGPNLQGEKSRSYSNTLLLLFLVMITPTAYIFGETLAPIPGESAAYNSGFDAAYLELPFKGHHTQDYLDGYINGTKGLQDNKEIITTSIMQRIEIGLRIMIGCVGLKIIQNIGQKGHCRP